MYYRILSFTTPQEALMPLTAGNSHHYAPGGPSDVIVLDTGKFLGDVREVIREALDGGSRHRRKARIAQPI